MKKFLMFALFLGLLIMTATKKPRNVIARVNKIFRMFSVSEFVEDYTPSKYAQNLLKEDLEVSSLSIKIQLVRDSIMSVLDHLAFDEATIQKIATLKVSQLMDIMDIFVSIAKGGKDGASLAGIRGVVPELCEPSVMTSKLSNAGNVKDAVEFIKDIIHPDSVLNNNSKRKQKIDKTIDEENDSKFENEKKSKKKQEPGNEPESPLSDADDGDLQVQPKPNRTRSEKYGGFQEVITNKKYQRLIKNENEEENEDEEESSESEDNKVVPKRKNAPKFKKPTKASPRFLSMEEINQIESENPSKIHNHLEMENTIFLNPSSHNIRHTVPVDEDISFIERQKDSKDLGEMLDNNEKVDSEEDSEEEEESQDDIDEESQDEEEEENQVKFINHHKNGMQTTRIE